MYMLFMTILWVWGWLPHRLSKRQSLSTTVLFRAAFTLTIMLNLLMKWLLGSIRTNMDNKTFFLWSVYWFHWLPLILWTIKYYLLNLIIMAFEGLLINGSSLIYRYGGHIKLIAFKEYYGMPRKHEHDLIYSHQYLRALFGLIFL